MKLDDRIAALMEQTASEAKAEERAKSPRQTNN